MKPNTPVLERPKTMQPEHGPRNPRQHFIDVVKPRVGASEIQAVPSSVEKAPDFEGVPESIMIEFMDTFEDRNQVISDKIKLSQLGEQHRMPDVEHAEVFAQELKGLVPVYEAMQTIKDVEPKIIFYKDDLKLGELQKMLKGNEVDSGEVKKKSAGMERKGTLGYKIKNDTDEKTGGWHVAIVDDGDNPRFNNVSFDGEHGEGAAEAIETITGIPGVKERLRPNHTKADVIGSVLPDENVYLFHHLDRQIRRRGKESDGKAEAIPQIDLRGQTMVKSSRRDENGKTYPAVGQWVERLNKVSLFGLGGPGEENAESHANDMGIRLAFSGPDYAKAPEKVAREALEKAVGPRLSDAVANVSAGDEKGYAFRNGQTHEETDVDIMDELAELEPDTADYVQAQPLPIEYRDAVVGPYVRTIKNIRDLPKEKQPPQSQLPDLKSMLAEIVDTHKEWFENAQVSGENPETVYFPINGTPEDVAELVTADKYRSLVKQQKFYEICTEGQKIRAKGEALQWGAFTVSRPKKGERVVGTSRQGKMAFRSTAGGK